MKTSVTLSLFISSLIAASSAFGGMVDTYGIGSRATALGGAFTATADDPFAVYYNPAGLAGIETPVVSGGMLAIQPSINVYDYEVNEGVASDIVKPIYEASGGRLYPAYPNVQGKKDFTDKSDPVIAPHLGFASPLTEKISIGIAAYAPWGLEVDWSDDPAENPGAYNTYHSYYFREAVSPTVAFRITEHLSAGVGISIGKSKVGSDYISADTGRKIEAELEDSLNYSFNAGIMYTPLDWLSLGLTYRGRTETDFSGDLDVEGYGNVSALSLSYDHPEQVQAGIRFMPGEAKNISLEVDYVWTNWSINESQTETITPPFMGITRSAVPKYWEDTNQFRFGVEWDINDTVSLRGGYFYDPTPVPDETMDFIWPDADKKSYSIGMGLNFKPVTVDLVVTCSDIDRKRYIDGESTSLNKSYHAHTFDPETHEITGILGEPAEVRLQADGNVWCGGITVSYTF